MVRDEGENNVIERWEKRTLLLSLLGCISNSTTSAVWVGWCTFSSSSGVRVLSCESTSFGPLFRLLALYISLLDSRSSRVVFKIVTKHRGMEGWWQRRNTTRWSEGKSLLGGFLICVTCNGAGHLFFDSFHFVNFFGGLFWGLMKGFAWDLG